MIDLRILGGLDLRDDDGSPIGSLLSRPKRLAILCFLTTEYAGSYCPRDVLLALFWPDSAQEAARKALNQALHVLRRGLGEGVVVSGPAESVGIDPDRLSCDVVVLERRLREDPEEALTLYQGELLEGFWLDGSLGFERWLDGQRARVTGLVAEAAVDLGNRSESGGAPEDAIRWLQFALRVRPYDQAIVSKLIKLIARAGDAGEALQTFDTFAERLRVDLDLAPGAELSAVMNAVREEAAPTTVAMDEPRSPERATDPPAASVDSVAIPTTTSHAVARSLFRWPLAFLGLGVVALAVVALAVVALRWAGAPVTGSAGPALVSNRVLVAVLANETGDPAWDPLGAVASDYLTVGLVNTGQVEVVPFITAVRALRRAGEEGSTAREASLPRELASVTGSGLLVTGSYQLRDSILIFRAGITDGLGRRIRSFEGIEAPIETPMSGVEVLRQRLMGAVGSIVDPRVRQWAETASQPPTYDAYQDFAEGMDLFAQYRFEEALDRFRLASEADSAFTAPVIWSLHAQGWGMDRAAAADSIVQLLLPRRGQLPEWDRGVLDYHHALIEGDWDVAVAAIERVARTSPRSEWAYLGAEVRAMALNRPLEAAERLVVLGPELGPGPGLGWLPYWRARLSLRHQGQDYERQLADVELAREEQPNCCIQEEIDALIGLGRTADALDRIERRTGGMESREVPGRVVANYLARVSSELVAHGHTEIGSLLRSRSLELLQADAPAGQAGDPFRAAQLLVSVGQWEEARVFLEEVDPEGHPLDIPGYLAVIAAHTGRAAEARETMIWYEGVGTKYSRSWTTLWRSRIAAALGDLDDAVTLLRFAIEQEGFGYYGWLHSDPLFEPLFGHPPFQELLRPKG